MRRATAFVLAGLVLLLAAAAVPVVGLAAAEWETDYVYEVDATSTYCENVVHESPSVDGGDDYRVDYANLSTTGQAHFDRALADGRYVVDDEADVASDFQFTDDHVAAGEGCYAVRNGGETYALRTSVESQRVGPFTGQTPALVGGSLLVLGAASLTVGLGLTVRRRFG